MIEKWTEKELEQGLTENGGRIAVEFYTDWCPTCKTLGAVLDRFFKDREGRSAIRLVQVNADEAPALCRRYGIRSVPTVLVFQNGEEWGRHVGSMSRGELDALLDSDSSGKNQATS